MQSVGPRADAHGRRASSPRLVSDQQGLPQSQGNVQQCCRRLRADWVSEEDTTLCARSEYLSHVIPGTRWVLMTDNIPLCCDLHAKMASV